MTTTTTAVPYGRSIPTVVHFDDLDAMGMLHNARYSVLVERTITSWWAERGVSFDGGKATTPDAFNVVRDFQITYHRPVLGTGPVFVHFWIERLGRTSVGYRFRVLSRDGEIVHAEGRRLAVRLDPATLRPAPWTDRGRELAGQLTAPSGPSSDGG